MGTPPVQSEATFQFPVPPFQESAVLRCAAALPASTRTKVIRRAQFSMRRIFIFHLGLIDMGKAEPYNGERIYCPKQLWYN